jgi:Leucine-rich repeat (LRR) protein
VILFSNGDSFNILKDIANNKIKNMSGLRGLKQLRKLDLGANRIRIMDPLELSGLVSLEELWLGKNKIEQIQGLESLTKLRRLDIQSNRLTAVENLSSQAATLEELFLAHNGIDNEGILRSTGLSQQSFPNLEVLDLGRNRLTSINMLSHLSALEELWVSGNLIESWDEVRQLGQLTNLGTIYLEYNPIQSLDPLYRKQLAEIIPSLTQIDANLIAGFGMTSTGLRQAATEQERLRQLQDAIVERAKTETLSPPVAAELDSDDDSRDGKQQSQTTT